MKTSIKLFLSAILFAIVSPLAMQAQDDLYYTPDGYYNYEGSYDSDNSGDTYVTNNYYGGDTEEYVYYEDEDYDYYYSSRVRRFHRPYRGFGYYDPCYTNSYWYEPDPFFWGRKHLRVLLLRTRSTGYLYRLGMGQTLS